MDPNATLRELRALATEILVRTSDQDLDLLRMAELIDALDTWIRRGGFLPADWSRTQ